MKQLILIVLLLGGMIVEAQDSSNTKSQVKLGLFYNSNLNYYGRTDSLKSAGTFLQLELWLTKGFYMSATPIVVHNAVNPFSYAGTTATIGYQHLTEDWLTNVFLYKPFYKEDTDLAQSVMKLSSGITVSRFTKVLNVTLGGDLRWSNRFEWGATAGLDHAFRIPSGREGTVVIDPSVYAYGGTQRAPAGSSRKGRGILPARAEDQPAPLKCRFALLAYEASMPVIFVKGKALFLVTPSHISPQNLVQVPGRPDLSERGESSFSLTIGMKYTF